MMVRTAVLLLYLVVLAALFALQLIFPVLAVFVFYGLLFWLVASFFVFRLPGMSRPLPGTGGARSGPAPNSPTAPSAPATAGGAPLPSTGPLFLGFCAFCGKDLASGTTVCPACGHPVQQF
jgi:hypothetical protein